MPKSKTFKWTVEFEVAECWVADGFDLTDERAKEMLAHDLSFAHGSELKARVTKAPKAEDVARAQGFKGAEGIKAIIEKRHSERLP